MFTCFLNVCVSIFLKLASVLLSMYYRASSIFVCNINLRQISVAIDIVDRSLTLDCLLFQCCDEVKKISSVHSTNLIHVIYLITQRNNRQHSNVRAVFSSHCLFHEGTLNILINVYSFDLEKSNEKLPFSFVI